MGAEVPEAAGAEAYGRVAVPGVVPDGPTTVFRPWPGVQSALVELPEPIDDALMGGGRFGGKSFGVCFDWLKHAKAYGHFAAGIAFRKTFDELEQLQLIFRKLFLPLGAVWLSGRRVWNFPGGATLKLRYLRHLKDAEKHQGFSYTYVFVDELGNYEDPEPIDVLQATLRSGDAPGIRKLFRATANPGGIGHSWIKKRYIDPTTIVRPDGTKEPRPFTPFYVPDARTWRVYLPSTLADNPSARNDPGALDRIHRATVGQPRRRKAWIDGDWEGSIEGTVFLGRWLGPEIFWQVLPAGRREVVLSCDLTFKDTAGSDMVALQVWARFQERPGWLYLLDQVRRRMTGFESAAAILALAGKYPDYSRVLVEDKANGPMVIEYLHKKIPKVLPFNPEGSKTERATVSAGYYEAGNIRVPDPAQPGREWVSDFLTEHTLFTGVKKKKERDDQIDAESQAVIDFERRPAPSTPQLVTFPGRMAGSRRRR